MFRLFLAIEFCLIIIILLASGLPFASSLGSFVMHNSSKNNVVLYKAVCMILGGNDSVIWILVPK